jgi:hypothetical protein
MKSKKLIKTTKAIREILVIDEVVVKCGGQNCVSLKRILK